MKIVCDNCATKYSIADEKVRGKVFKIRCKKCSHIIVVRGGADGNAEPARDTASSTGESLPVDDQQTMAARGGGGAATGDAVWHLVIDREQVGPMTPGEVRQKFSEGAIDAETYAWREGFGDWLRLASIEDFRDLGGGAAPAGDEGATRRTDSADLFAAAGGSDDSAPAPSEGGGDLFGGGAPAPSYASSPAQSEDVFGGGGALFGAPSAQPAPSRQQRTSSPGFAAQAQNEPAAPSGGAVEVRPMTGQRNENSVLFSLNNLQALATGGGGAKAAPSSSSSSSSSGGEARPGFANSQTEGSGLIDIRAMAASTLAASPSTGGPSGGKGDDLPGLGAAPVFSPMAAPILMPAAPSGPPKWMWAILGVGVAAVLGIVIVGILLLTKKGPEPAVAAAPTGTVPAAVAPSAAAPAAAAPAAAAPAATAQTPAAVAANDTAKEDKAAKHHKGGAAGGVKVAKNDAPKAESAAPPPVAAAPAPAAPAPKKGGKKDALDDLLDGATSGGGDTPKPHKKAAASDDGDSGGGAAAGGGADLPEQLDKQQIVGGMGRIKGRVAACYDQYKVPGMANVSVTIGNSGHVSNATVGGAFSGTPTGDCVSRAVKSATFPRFKGAAQTINYPFILR